MSWFDETIEIIPPDEDGNPMQVSKTKLIFYRFSFAIVIVYACLMVTSLILPVTRAQTYNELHNPTYDLERRIRVIEDQTLDKRVTILETIEHNIENGSTWLRINTGGTALLLVTAALKMFRSAGFGVTNVKKRTRATTERES